MSPADAYQPDRTLKGKLRRRLVRLAHRRPLARGPGAPMVSFTFDDAPLTATEAGARLLEARGARGVFYVSAGLAGTEGPMGRFAPAADYARLAQAGHEIACHTYSHLDCGQAEGDVADLDAARNRAALADWGAGPITNFAYPYGDVAAGPKGALSRSYGLLRALHHGVIEAGTDLNQAPAVGIEGPDGEAIAEHWLAKAQARNAWLILYTHDVRSDPSPWGCTPDALARLIDRAQMSGMQIVTVAEGAQRLGIETAAA
ncbi:polysaccharide deacetylase family protein [Phenylobacterium sp.]|uniref:oligosaccharide deacetylase HfsH n=1 Tax=Phenylobacterium sp. TaxID=1871053 RepID=UPI002730C5CE|nr:polysaccharide deacetylase family protein [Phenylobacterium sp.]MDP1873984.1 polysaccharide deacetylase family protein [Phenylobacterium sp.]MDP3488805.1 polysaccharide deacetylase family protein [Phenylobacterium sp.]